MQAHSSILMMSEERDQPTIFSDTACEKAATLTRLMASPLNMQNEDSLLLQGCTWPMTCQHKHTHMMRTQHHQICRRTVQLMPAVRWFTKHTHAVYAPCTHALTQRPFLSLTVAKQSAAGDIATNTQNGDHSSSCTRAQDGIPNLHKKHA